MKKVPFWMYVYRFFFESCCEYCTNIAVRESNPGKHKYCFNHADKASKDSWTPFGGHDIPLNSTAWKYDPKYSSPFQRLWIRLGLKEF